MPAATDYNRGMSAQTRHYVETLPADLDRFLGNFFARKGWRSEIVYDAENDRLYLKLLLADPRLSADDRFFSLVEYYVRAQKAFLRQNGGLALQCLLMAADGSDLTPQLQNRGAPHLDDVRAGPRMRRQLAWLSFRRRFRRRVVPGSLLWAAVLAWLELAMGVPLSVALLICFSALLIQAALIRLMRRRR